MAVQREQLMKRIFEVLIRCTVRPALSPGVPLWLQRACASASGLLQIAPAFRTTAIDISGITTHVIQTDSDYSGNGVLYLHGGGYVVGGIRSHAKLAAHLARSTHSKVWLPAYRKAPEHTFPAALHDAMVVYAALIQQGQDPRKLILAGDSAGGGLALSTAIAIRDAGLPMPAGIVLFSPWLDLSLSGETLKTHACRDAMLKPEWLRWCADAYQGNNASKEPGCSPLFANLRGLPPMLVHVGSEEVLLDDSRRLAAEIEKARGQITLKQFEGMGHVFQFHAGLLKESDLSLKLVRQFSERVIPHSTITIMERAS